MANAIKQISVQRGYDVTRYTLQCFGGAGGQHACLVADALGMTRVFIHPLAGVLSAYGMGLADQTAMREQAVELPLATRTRWRARAHGCRRSAPTRGASCRRRASAPQRIACDRARAPALRGHRHGADRRRSARSPAMRARVRGGLPPALRVPDAERARWSSRRSRSRRSARGDAPAEPRQHPRRVRAPLPRPRARCACTSAAHGTTRRSVVRDGHAAGRRDRRARDHRREQRDHRRRAGLARRRVTRARPPGARARRAARAAQARDRHRRRPGAARGLQQPVHVDRRADGPAAAEHRLLGQHQGAARFLLRAVRRRRAT